jgi:branched-chain amino acid transport system substrate-binding protein
MQRGVRKGRTRRATGAALAVVLLVVVATAAAVQGASAKQLESAATPRGEPIVVGSTLSLTGAFGATGAIHKVAGETFVRWINANGGLLGRPVRWELLDDESDPAKVSALYERLISQNKVDLIMGPYATPNIVAAQAVAERHGYVLPNHTAVLSYALNYRCQFPTWSTGGRPNIEVPRFVFQALKSQKQPPKRLAFVSNSGGSTNFVSYGPPSSSEGGAVSEARKAGFNVVLDLKYPPDVSDWGSIAAQVRAAQPDLVWNSGLALDPVNLLQALRQLNYKPKQFFTLFPAPGPLLAMGPAANGVLSLSLFEPNGRLLKRLGAKAQQIVANFGRAAAAARLPYRVFDTQAAASWTAWEALAQGVQGAKSLEHERVCDYLLRNGVKSTFIGNLKFNQQQHNFPQNVGALKQIQDGRWKVVYPVSKRDARLLAPGGLK